MVMESIQIRLPRATVQSIDAMVRAGIYGSRSDAIRDASRKLFWMLQNAKTDPNFKIGPKSDYTEHRLIRPREPTMPDIDEINTFVAHVSKQIQQR